MAKTGRQTTPPPNPNRGNPLTAAGRYLRAAVGGFFSDRADSTVLQQASVKPVKPDLNAEVATYTTTDRQQSTILKDISLDTIASAISQADRGNIRAIVELAELVEERDCHVAAVLQSRKLAVVGKSWSVVPAGPVGTPEAVAVAEACDKMLRSLPDIETAYLDSLDAILKGLSVLEIIWGSVDGKPTPIDLVWRHPKKFTYNTSNADYPVDQLRLLTPESPVWGIELPPDKFLVHAPRTRSGWKSRAGIIRQLSLIYAIKYWALADWAAFAEVFASPLKLGKYEPGTPPAEIAALKTGLESLGSNGAAIISKMSDITFPSAASSGGDKVYLELCRYLDAQVSKAVLGHVASADAVSGSLGGAETAAVAIRQDILEADARALESTYRRSLLSPYVRLNFPGAEVPYLHFDVAVGEDLLARAQVDEKLVAMGWRVPVSYISDVYGRPIAGDGEAVLAPPVPPAAPASPGSPGGGGSVPPFEFGAAERGYVPLPAKNAQGYAEELAAQTLKDALPMWRAYLKPVADAIQQAETFDDLQNRLSKVGLKSNEIADLLHRAKLTAQMVGRLAVQGDVGMALGDMPATLKPLSPDEAVEWLDKRLDLSPDDFKAADDATRTAAFTVAGEQDTKIIEEVRRKVQEALKSGATLKEFQESLGDLEGTDIGRAHAETIFRNAVNQSVSAGRWKQQTSPEVLKLRPYLQYRTAGDGSVRSAHRKFDGLVYPADHDFWATHYPPNGHNCRCTVVSLSARQLKARGLSVSDSMPDASPEDGFGANPGELE